MARWTEEQKQKALALAEATSAREASKQTGIPLSTIGRWMGQQKRNGTNGTEQVERNGTERPSKKTREIAEEAIEEAKEAVKEYVIDRSKEVADGILDMVKKAVIEADRIIKEGPKEEEPNAGWLRAVVGAMAQGVEKYNLMTGQPTSRQEMKNTFHRREEHIIRILQEDPEALEALEQLNRRARALKGADDGGLDPDR